VNRVEHDLGVIVMAGLGRAIHVFVDCIKGKDVDSRPAPAMTTGEAADE
jgi:hypothetical protein